MRIIIPMAGMGKRLRPHTLTMPKPLIPVAGKPIIQWLVEDLTKMCKGKVEEIGFVLGDFGKDVEKQLLNIAKQAGAKGKIYYQTEPLGTAHAILCAQDMLKGKVIVAFADTLFSADFNIEENEDGVIWVHKIEDPTQFGVVKTDKNGVITEFVEKPRVFVSDLAIIGVYYFKDGEFLNKEMQYLIKNNIKDKGEYQLTSALQNMKNKGAKFKVGNVKEWLDCGNKDATVYTNQRMLDIKNVHTNGTLNGENTLIIEPCFVGKDAVIRGSVIGPYVSIGEKCIIENSIIKNSIIQNNTTIKNRIIENSMIGSQVKLSSPSEDLNIGDYTIQNK
jgi:glucose-1-phosphate thymidylyltransferase